jgi:hypothetical protein
MGFLKGLGTFVCSFLLFLALMIFSMGYMIHNTVLSADFVNKQVNRIDIASISRDIAEDQIGKELPKEAEVLKEVAYDVISAEEPWIKEQLNYVVDTGYDYFLGNTDTLNITVSLEELKLDLSDDMWEATRNYLEQKLAGKSEYEISRYLEDFARQFPPEILPSELALLTPVDRDLAIEQFFRKFAGQEPLPNVPQYNDQIENSVRIYFNDYLAEFTRDIPDSYSIDESSVGAGQMDTIRTVRKYIGYFENVYWWLIAFMVVMAGLIFLINRDVKVTTRSLGINLLVFGVLDLAGAILAKVITPTKFLPDVSDVPVSVQNIIDNVTKDIGNIALIFAIGVLVIGAALFTVSFFVKSRQAQAG